MRGKPANLALLTHSETEFVMDFIYIQPQAPKAKVRSRIITSPAHAKPAKPRPGAVARQN